MHRFYQKNITDKHTSFEIRDNDITRQISKVLRMKPGEKISLFNGDGMDFLCEIKSVSRDSAVVNVLSVVAGTTERKTKVHLYQAVPNVWAKFEEVVKKCTELGATSFHPIIMERSETHLKNGDIPPKSERLNKIMVEACEQCGGSILPVIHNIEDFKMACDNAAGMKIMAYEGDLSNGLGILKYDDTISLFVGPEGGITEEEAEYFRKTGGQTFNLGKRILRTETAPVAILGRLFFSTQYKVHSRRNMYENFCF